MRPLTLATSVFDMVKGEGAKPSTVMPWPLGAWRACQIAIAIISDASWIAGIVE